ncbi:hypothetical protein MNL09_03055 [Bartonella krasnovii]|nr:hypothetical protein MNL09_03055 [Bartonella krasnovii]
MNFKPLLLQYFWYRRTYAFDNAKLQAGETILIQAGGSGIGSAAIQLTNIWDVPLSRL